MQDSLPSKLLYLVKRQIAASISIFDVVLVTGSLGFLAINSTMREGTRFATNFFDCQFLRMDCGLSENLLGTSFYR